jgi:histidine ammonia-lyase
MTRIILDAPLTWAQIVAIARRESTLELSPGTRARLNDANLILRAIIEKNIPAYGVNTGVGALSDIVVPQPQQAELSKNILMSHAVGVGAPLGVEETRAIMAASVNNFALGYSGLRLQVTERIVELLNAGCSAVVPRQGSVGYISHRAHIGLVLIGYGYAELNGERLPAKDALHRLGLEPLVLQAKEGLCLVNGTACATGLACLAVARAQHLMQWADAIAAMSFESQRCQLRALDPTAMALHASPGLGKVAGTLRRLLSGSAILAAATGRRTQDPLSLRGIPQVHGAVHDVWNNVVEMIERELGSVTDNPAISGSPEAPQAFSQAHAVGAAIGFAMDHLAIAMAQLGTISERRLDRMVNPLVNGLPAFLAKGKGVASGFMIAQYTSLSLVSENRRLAAPSSLDSGVTSGLQEDMLCHATPGALKVLDILANTQNILAIEFLAACQSYDLFEDKVAPAPRILPLYRALRQEIATYADDRPLGEDIAIAAQLLCKYSPDGLLREAGM